MLVGYDGGPGSRLNTKPGARRLGKPESRAATASQEARRRQARPDDDGKLENRAAMASQEAR